MSERSGDWGAGLCPGVGLVLAAGTNAKTMTSLLNIPTVLSAALLKVKIIISILSEYHLIYKALLF